MKGAFGFTVSQVPPITAASEVAHIGTFVSASLALSMFMPVFVSRLTSTLLCESCNGIFQQ
jgi:hypothetical protein